MRRVTRLCKVPVSVLALCIGMGGGVYTSWADESAPVVNDPVGAYYTAKQVVDTLKPQGGVCLNLADGDVQAITTVAVYEVSRAEAVLGSLRGGYGVDKTLILALEANLGSVVPEGWPVVPVLARYVKLGFAGGRNFDDHEFVYGPTVALQASW